VTGVQYVLPDGLDVAGASELLATRLELVPERARAADRTFYDTFDGRLHSEGLALVHEDGRLALVDSDAYGERAAADHPTAPKRVLVEDLPPGPVRELLEPIVTVRALTPIARVRSSRRPLRVIDRREKTVVRLVVEVPSPPPSTRAGGTLHGRVHVLPVRGYDKALARVRRTLERELGLAEAAAPLHDEAVAAAGGTPGGASAKLGIALRPAERADSAAATVLARLLAVIEANMPGTLADVDSEFLHDLRVAVRRTRSVQRQLAGVFPPEPLTRFRAEFRWLQQVTGPTRDLDVYLLELEAFGRALPAAAARDLEPLRDLLRGHRRREYRRMCRELRSARATALLVDWSQFVERFPAAPGADRPLGTRPIVAVAGGRIRAVYRRMLKMGDTIDEASPPESLHDLRKKGKELRYLLELFASLYPPEVIKPAVRRLKALQDTLGRFQDREVQAGLLRSLREEVAALDDGAAALMAMGLLVDRLEREQAAARAEFGERFAAFAAKRQRALFEETFA
jgi:CHAD domain-containing protein